MGLDMYLYAKLYTSEYTNKEQNKKLQKAIPDIYSINNIDTIKLKFECGYWRKANAIHKWFVDNVQNGQDECNAHDVSREDLKELRALCVEILKDKEKAKELLPTQEGFFFGSTEMDECYFSDLQATIDIIDRCLKLPECWEFEYRSSW